MLVLHRPYFSLIMAAVVPNVAPLPLVAGIPADLHHVFGLIGLTPAEMARLMLVEHFNSINNLGFFDAKEISSIVSDYAKLPANATRIVFGITRMKRFQAVAHWVRKQTRVGAVIDYHDLTAATLNAEIIELTLSRSDEAAKSSERLYPAKFEPSKFVPWTETMRNFLDGIRGENGVALSYVIRPEVVDLTLIQDEVQRAIFLAPHTGPAYEADRRQVYRYLKGVLLGTDGWAWFEAAPEGDGRTAWFNLTEHYNGPTELRRRANEAEAKLVNLHYRNESAFSFERYITKLKEYYHDLEEAGQGYTDWQKVKRLTKGVQSSDARVSALLVLVKSLYPNDFDAACSHMATQIADIYPPTANIGKNTKISALFGRGNDGNKGRGGRGDRGNRGGRGRDGGRGGGRGNKGQKGQGKMYMSGVDVTDITRKFSEDEWKKLSNGGHLGMVQFMRQKGKTPTNNQNNVIAAATTNPTTATPPPTVPTNPNPPAASAQQNGNGPRFGKGNQNQN